MQVQEIGYGTQIVEPYAKATRACGTVAELVAELQANWSELCPDALECARQLTDDEWRWVLQNANRAKQAKRVVELAGPVLMPRTLVLVAEVAAEFFVPDGLAWHNLKEAGLLDASGPERKGVDQ
jgi:hypothetical protein